MRRSLQILDYSVHGNMIDAESDRLLAGAATAAGIPATVTSITREAPVHCDADCAWLRYDLRSRAELSWIVSVAAALQRQGHRVFPSALAILLSEDKWESYHAFREHAVPTPATVLALAADRVALPAMVKRRAGWGGQGNRVLRAPGDLAAEAGAPLEDCICQPLIRHCRTWIVPVVGGRELFAIEARREPEHDGEVQVLPLPAGGAGLGAAAVAAVGLPAGTVDLIETEAGPLVLEVNSAPRIPYPDLPGVDLAAPMVRAVWEWLASDAARRWA